MRLALQKRLDPGKRELLSGKFFEAHDAFERVWRRSTGAERDLVQALVLWAAAMHHLTRQRPEGASRLLARAVDRSGRARSSLPQDAERLSDALTSTWESLATSSTELSVRWPFRDEAEPETIDVAYARSCPYCGAAVTVWVEPERLGGTEYVEDCPVCCQPWEVKVRQDDGRVDVALARDDD